MESKDLLKVIGEDAAAEPGFCNQPSSIPQFEKGPPYWWDWEAKVALPRLVSLGYKLDYRGFQTGDGDSFGPLTRFVRVEKDGVRTELVYG